MKTPTAAKKILVLTGFPPRSAGGGAWIIDQLLQGIDRRRLLWWSSQDQPGPEAAGAVGRFFGGRLPNKLIPYTRWTGLKTALIRHAWMPRAVRELREFISEEQPEQLWIIPHAWSIPVLHAAIRDLGIPWHISVHDFPYPSANRWVNSFQGLVDDLYRGAASRDVIGPEMADELERTTGFKTDAFFRCAVEPEEMDYIRQKVFVPPQGTIKIGYPGTIIAERTFAQFLEALRLLQPRLPLPVQIHLFTGHSYRDRPWFDANIIVEHGFLFGEKLDEAYRQCDWGLAIMPLEETNPRYSRYSFPCKFTKSLGSGMPIISLGHAESALIRLANRFKLGPVITTDNVAKMASEIFSELTRPEPDRTLKERFLACAESEFNAAANRKRLRELLA